MDVKDLLLRDWLVSKYIPGIFIDWNNNIAAGSNIDCCWSLVLVVAVVVGLTLSDDEFKLDDKYDPDTVEGIIVVEVVAELLASKFDLDKAAFKKNDVEKGNGNFNDSVVAFDNKLSTLNADELFLFEESFIIKDHPEILSKYK